MNRLVQEVLVVVVVNVLVAEPTSWATGAEPEEVVVVVGDVQMSKIDVTEYIAVSDEGRLPVVVKVIPAHSYPVRTTNDVDESILYV